MCEDDSFSVDPKDALRNKSKLHLEMAEELDRMERDVTSWEAEFLDSILKRLRSGTALTERQAKTLQEMRWKYTD